MDVGKGLNFSKLRKDITGIFTGIRVFGYQVALFFSS